MSNSRFNHDVIFSLYPNARVVKGGGPFEVFDENGDAVVIDEVAVSAEEARLEAEHDSKAYARARAEAYAPIAEQLDMQYWDSVNGSRTWLDHIEAVKEAHPK